MLCQRHDESQLNSTGDGHEGHTIVLRWLVGLDAADEGSVEEIVAQANSSLWQVARHAQPGDTVCWNGNDGLGGTITLTAVLLEIDGRSVK